MESTYGVHSESLFAYLARVPDPRRRQARQYPLVSIIAMLVLAAIHGESSLRGMWLWAKARWERLWEPLGFPMPNLPSLSQVWYVAARLEEEQLERVLGDWLEAVGGGQGGRISVDGKTLRGSRRVGQSPLQVVEAVGQELKVVLGQRSSQQGDEVEAALALLRELPLEGRLVTLDAGLLQREVAQTILARGGDYLGVLKENHPQLKATVDGWIKEQVFPPGEIAATRPSGGE